MELSDSEIAVCSLLRNYIERQHVVFRLLESLRPDLLAIAQRKVPDQDVFLSAEKYKNTPSSGYWGDNAEWSYFIHGYGCRLVNQVTGECIEWDAPDIEVFERHWFSNYVEWFLKHNANDAPADIILQITDFKQSSLRDFIFKVLDDLFVKKVLSYPNPANMNKMKMLK